MKISSIQLYHVDLRNRPPHHQLFILRVLTDEGLEGAGEIAMPYGVSGESLIGALTAVARRFALGADPEKPEALWQKIFFSSYWALGHSLPLYAAMSGLDIACWDLKGKILDRPIHNLLGGATRQHISLYANHWYGDASEPSQFAERAAAAIEKGWKGLKFDPFREHAGRTQPAARHLEPSAARRGIARARAVREAIGYENRLYFDLHGALRAADVLRWGPALCELEPEFIEEPTDTLEPGATEAVRRGLPPSTPLAGGERLYLRQHFLPYLEKRLFQTIQPDVCQAGGITECRKIAALADAYQIHLQLHNCAGPVCTAASLHVMAAAPNAPVQEWFPFWEDERYSIVEQALEFLAEGSEFDIEEHLSAPGLGIRLNHDYLSRFPVLEVK